MLEDNKRYELNLKAIKAYAPTGSGVYYIHADRKFSRLSKKTTDIIYIGKGDNLRERLMTFPKGFHFLKKNPTKIYKSRRALPRFIKLQDKKILLSFSCKLNKKAKELEKRILKEYEREYWELPPLNHAS